MKHQAPSTKPQRSFKLQAPKMRLEFCVWLFSGAWVLALGVFLSSSLSTRAATLELSIRHTFAGEPLQLGPIRYDNSAKENFSITRLSYLLSGFAFQRDDGSWLDLTNSVAWFDAEKERTSTQLEIPSGTYRSVRF